MICYVREMKTCPTCKDTKPLTVSRELYRLDSVSMDRIDSSKGYDPGNVALTCNVINRAKGDSSLVEFSAFLDQLVTARSQRVPAAAE